MLGDVILTILKISDSSVKFILDSSMLDLKIGEDFLIKQIT
jgi:hypothetical protein